MSRHILNIIRWPNLVIVALVQLLLYYKLVNAGNSVLSPVDFLLLTLVTIMIAGGGYVINDYYDYPIDLINKPKNWIAGNSLPMQIVLQLYWIVTGIGALMSIVLAFRLELLPFLLIYPLAVGALWLYSYTLKCKPVIGNIWVSLFCAGVVLILALPDYIKGGSDAISHHLVYYGLFAFLVTWYREMVKDIEDIKGDQLNGCRTFAVRFGAQPSKIISLGIVICLLFAVYQWMLLQSTEGMEIALNILQGFIVTSMAFVWWAKDKQYYRIASLLIKVVMLLGTIVLLLL